MLEAWLADLLVDEAANARARAAWLERQATEEATFLGVLADLAERERQVVIDTVADRRYLGMIRVVGQDFCALRTKHDVDVLVRYEAIASARPAPREQGTVGDRFIAPVVTFDDALGALSGSGARVTVTGLGGTAVHGELRSVGHDVLTLRLDDRSVAYVRLASVGELSVVESG